MGGIGGWVAGSRGEMWLEIHSSIVESFFGVTILRLGPLPKHCWIISNSEWKPHKNLIDLIVVLFRLVAICLRTSNILFTFLTVEQIPGIRRLPHPAFFRSGMLPTYHSKYFKTRNTAKALVQWESGLEVPGTAINSFCTQFYQRL